jgi:hypothetical protein
MGLFSGAQNSFCPRSGALLPTHPLGPRRTWVIRLCGGVGRSPLDLSASYAAASRGRVSDRFFSAAYAAAHANRCRLEEEMGLFSGAQNFFCPRSGAALRTHLSVPGEPGQPPMRRRWAVSFRPRLRLRGGFSRTRQRPFFSPPTRRLMRTVAGSKRRWVSFPGHKTFSVPGQELRSGSIFPVPGEPGQPPMRRRSTISFRPRLRLRGGFSRTHQRPFLLSHLCGGSCEPLPARRGDGSLFRGAKLFLSPVRSAAPDPSTRSQANLGHPPMRRRWAVSFRPRLRLRGGFSRTRQRPFFSAAYAAAHANRCRLEEEMGLFSGAQNFFCPRIRSCAPDPSLGPRRTWSAAYAAALGGLLSASPPPTRRLLEDASATVSSQPPTRRLMRTVAGSKRRWVSFPGHKTFSVPGRERCSRPIFSAQANLGHPPIRRLMRAIAGSIRRWVSFPAGKRLMAPEF